MRTIAVLVQQTFYRPSTGVGEWATGALRRVETAAPDRRTAVLAAAAWQAFLEGDSELARARAQDALRDGLPTGALSPEPALSVLALATSFSGNHDAGVESIAAGRRALDDLDASDRDRARLATAEIVVNLNAGRYEEARALAEDVLQRARRVANPSLLIISLRWFAATRRPDEGNDALQALEECLNLSRAVATPHHPDALQALAKLATFRARRGDHRAALETLREAVSRAHDAGHMVVILTVLNYGVSVAVELGAWELAAKLGAMVTDEQRTEFVLMSATELEDQHAAIERARTRLGADRYDAALANGTAMSYEQIIEYTLGELDRLLADSPESNGFR